MANYDVFYSESKRIDVEKKSDWSCQRTYQWSFKICIRIKSEITCNNLWLFMIESSSDPGTLTMSPMMLAPPFFTLHSTKTPPHQRITVKIVKTSRSNVPPVPPLLRHWIFDSIYWVFLFHKLVDEGGGSFHSTIWLRKG